MSQCVWEHRPCWYIPRMRAQLQLQLCHRGNHDPDLGLWSGSLRICSLTIVRPCNSFSGASVHSAHNCLPTAPALTTEEHSNDVISWLKKRWACLVPHLDTWCADAEGDHGYLHYLHKSQTHEEARKPLSVDDLREKVGTWICYDKDFPAVLAAVTLNRTQLPMPHCR